MNENCQDNNYNTRRKFEQSIIAPTEKIMNIDLFHKRI